MRTSLTSTKRTRVWSIGPRSSSSSIPSEMEFRMIPVEATFAGQTSRLGTSPDRPSADWVDRNAIPDKEPERRYDDAMLLLSMADVRMGGRTYFIYPTSPCFSPLNFPRHTERQTTLVLSERPPAWYDGVNDTSVLTESR